MPPIRPTTSRRRRRPPEVTLIAIFQFLKAIALMSVSVLSFVKPATLLAYPVAVSILVYVAAHGRNPRGFLIPLYAMSIACTGWGLWRLKKWSRYATLLSAAITAGLLFYSKEVQDSIRDGDFLANFRAPTDMAVGIVVAIDIIIFGYLIAYPDTSHAFNHD